MRARTRTLSDARRHCPPELQGYPVERKKSPLTSDSWSYWKTQLLEKRNYTVEL